MMKAEEPMPPAIIDAINHNKWVQSLIDDVEFETLKQFLEQLKDYCPICKKEIGQCKCKCEEQT